MKRIKQSSITLIAAGFVVLAGCSPITGTNPQQTEQPNQPVVPEFPTGENYRRVFNSIIGQTLGEAMLVQAFISHGIRPPDQTQTKCPECGIVKSGGWRPLYTTTLTWVKNAHSWTNIPDDAYSIEVSVRYTKDEVFQQGAATYKRRF